MTNVEERLLAEKEIVMIDKHVMEDAYPVTKMQLGMIYHSMSGRGEIYHDVASYYVDKRLDENCFRKTIELLTQKHDILRTVFSIYDYKQPIQVVLSDYEVNITYVDISNVEEKSRQLRLEELSANEEKARFSFEKELMIRFFGIKLSDRDFQLMLSFHHAILDGWSVQKLVMEFIEVYSNLMEGRGGSMTNLAIKFKDYVACELEASSSGECMRFWDDYLYGCVPHLLSQGTQKNVFLVVERLISGDRYNRIDRLCNEMRVPMKILFKAVVLISLMNELKVCKYVMGEVTHGRLNCEDGDNVLGMFLNTIPLKLTSKMLSLVEVVNAVAADEREKYPFRRYPFFDMLKEHKGELFDVLVNYTKFDISNADISVTDYVRRTFLEKTNYKLTIHGSEVKGTLRLVLNFDKSVVSKDLTERLLGRMESLLCDAEIMLNPWEDIGIEKAVVSGRRVEHTDNTLVTRFNQQVSLTPEALAIKFAEKSLTYKIIDDYSNRVANYLINAGAGKDRAVAVVMNRSIELMATIYGIVKAGCAYVPLDSDFPQERISYIISEISPICIITDETSPYMNFGIKVISTQTIKQITENGNNLPCDRSCADGIAYIIYTSGSTGKPKGVMIEHKSIVNRLDWMQRQFTLDKNDVVLQKTPYTFDVSVWELFWPLFCGAKLVIAPPKVHRDSMYLARFIKEEGITTVHFVPSMLNIFLQCDIRGCTCLKRVICSGEELTAVVVNRFYNVFGTGTTLYNLYGPTEAAVDVTYWQCTLMDEKQKVPIGYAVDNTDIYILDQYLKPVYGNEEGEICLAGVQLARGYINRPELTEEKFNIVNIDGRRTRIYRTGDVGFIQNNAVMYSGRMDFQVKLNGLRIELGEIENVINAIPQVSESVALVKEGRNGSKMLVAYVAGNNIEENMIKKRIKKFLPKYMIPSKIILVDAIPHLFSGKINRKDLQRREISFEETEFVYPRTVTEEIVAKIFASVLGLVNVSVNWPFDEMGGDSLKALVLVGKIDKVLNTDFSLAKLSIYNTIALISEYITLGEKSPSSNLVCFKKTGERKPFFCIHPFGGHVYTYGSIGKYFDENRPFYGIQAEGLDGVNKPFNSIEKMAEKYICEIKKVQSVGPYYIGGWCMGGIVAYEVGRQLLEAGDEIGKLVIINSSVVEEVPSHMRINDLELFKYAIAQTSDLETDLSICDDIDGKMRKVYEEAVDKGVIRGDINSYSHALHIYEIYKAHRKAMLEYTIKPLNIKGVLIKASKNHLKDNEKGFLGWEKAIKVERYVVEGTHYNIFLEPQVKEFANTLTMILGDNNG